MQYRGRFAPSPTGPMHFGSLFAACVSFIDAQFHQGSWLIRIENIDPPREQTGAIDQILKCLEAHALISPEPVSYQSDHYDRYETLLGQLRSISATFPCPCSRKDLDAGHHLEACIAGKVDHLACATKFRAHPQMHYAWNDLCIGTQRMTCEQDFVLKRKDNLYAYQLAVVADDIAQGITHVVRGNDLLESTPMQLALYDALNLPPPKFGHFPIIQNSRGQKLSKQNRSCAVDSSKPEANLRLVAEALALPVPDSARSCVDILNSLLDNWSLTRLTHQKHLLAPTPYQAD